MRDHQRGKLYRAEQVIPKGQLLELDETNEYIRYLAKKMGSSSIPVLHNYRLTSHEGWYVPSGYIDKVPNDLPKPRIEIPRVRAWERILMHEYCHHLSRASHGWVFCNNLLILTETILGHAVAVDLENAYTDSGVIYNRIDEEERMFQIDKADDRARDRDGERGMGYILRAPPGKYKSGKPHPTRWVFQVDQWGPQTWTPTQRRAFVWRRESTAAKWAGSVKPPQEIMEVDVVYDGQEKKWRVYDGDPLTALLV